MQSLEIWIAFAALAISIIVSVVGSTAALMHSLGELKGKVHALESSLTLFRTELKAEIADVKSELKAEIADAKSELKADMREGFKGTNDRITKLEVDLGSVRRARG